MPEIDQPPRRARVFVSCGQSKQSSELDTAEKIRVRLQELGFDPYIAVEEQTLRGLKENIFRQLETSEYFVFVDFKREELVLRGTQPIEAVYRGSLFSHQELAVASYLDIPLLAYQERGAKKDDGILRFLQANAIEFTDRNLLPNVIADEVRRRGWNPNARNELALERRPSQFVDAQVYGTQVVRRFYYVDVRNLHPRQTARNCYVYLEKVVKLNQRTEIPFGSVELKWAGYTLPNAHILPQKVRPFDALFIPFATPTQVGFNAFSDSTLFGRPLIDAAGEYELHYAVVSDNFPIARCSVLLTLSSTLDRTTLEPIGPPGPTSDRKP
ncbi:MAG: hypothetical protein ABSA54_09515 [Terriglobales bacterium]|jgi:hypothetical protein